MTAKFTAKAHFIAFALNVFVSGCASSGPALVLAPVGPPVTTAPSSSAQGTLLVYSAYNTGVPNPYRPDDIQQCTDYEIRSQDGKPLRKISNQSGFQGEDPLPVRLPAGNYRVVARANGYGLVTVPVVIAAAKTTTLHLEGGDSRSGKSALTVANSVRLPGGEIVGWQAVKENPSAGSSP